MIDPRAAVPGYIPSDVPSTASHQTWDVSGSQGTPDLPRINVGIHRALTNAYLVIFLVTDPYHVWTFFRCYHCVLVVMGWMIMLE